MNDKKYTIRLKGTNKYLQMPIKRMNESLVRSFAKQVNLSNEGFNISFTTDPIEEIISWLDSHGFVVEDLSTILTGNYNGRSL